MHDRIRLAVLISAGGTTLQNLIDKIRARELAAHIVQVVSSNPDVAGVERAWRAGLPVGIVTRKDAGSREEFSQRIFDFCRRAEADLVCMAGFLHLVTIPSDFTNRVLNIHPSLIPAFCGKGYYGHHVHEAVLAKGVKITGCTVHFADNEYDHGPIVVQRAVPVCEEDTPETLAQRVYEQECEAYPEAIRLYAAGRLRVEGQRCRILPESAPTPLRSS
jgi:formyltetrahydrofolate-dependent phosphoribosylglycinamide formyltransferase